MFTTRIAPSPTGYMHVGTARTALFCWLAARASGGRFILRIDDTDLDRNIDAAVQPVFDGLDWLGLDCDLTVRQSDRTDVYRQHALMLLEAGLASSADNGAILLKMPADMPATWTDEVGGRMPVTADAMRTIDGLPLLRGGDRAGQATYQFASVVDDYVMGIDFVIRGTDHIANTGKQIAIWLALSKVASARPLPRFAHVGLIFKDGKKMSKRDGAPSLLDYRDDGSDPDAMFNFLLRMGWGPKVDDKSTTTIDRARALELFLDGGKMRAANSNFDAAKLAFYDRTYKRRKAAAPNSGDLLI
jgi:glutamyl/glutaminyl-tRNA synthetase